MSVGRRSTIDNFHIDIVRKSVYPRWSTLLLGNGLSNDNTWYIDYGKQLCRLLFQYFAWDTIGSIAKVNRIAKDNHVMLYKYFIQIGSLNGYSGTVVIVLLYKLFNTMFGISRSTKICTYH